MILFKKKQFLKFFLSLLVLFLSPLKLPYVIVIFHMFYRQIYFWRILSCKNKTEQKNGA